jgi:simple sugar transport system ATP-binding protein
MIAATSLVELREASKFFGHVVALERVSMSVRPGEVLCLLGDNGAGKSTLIKLLSGVFHPDEGSLWVDGSPTRFGSPRDAVAAGIATVYQDLALFPLMSISRNFIVGTEPAHGRGMLAAIRFREADTLVRQKLLEIGIEVRNTSDLVGTLSGGERQTLAIARAEHIGARLLILDEPTSALGVKEAAIVLRNVLRARAKGLAIVFITHNVHHAHVVGDRFLFLSRGRVLGEYDRNALTVEEMTRLMGGGSELEELANELEQLRLGGESDGSGAAASGGGGTEVAESGGAVSGAAGGDAAGSASRAQE